MECGLFIFLCTKRIGLEWKSATFTLCLNFEKKKHECSLSEWVVCVLWGWDWDEASWGSKGVNLKSMTQKAPHLLNPLPHPDELMNELCPEGFGEWWNSPKSLAPPFDRGLWENWVIIFTLVLPTHPIVIICTIYFVYTHGLHKSVYLPL